MCNIPKKYHNKIQSHAKAKGKINKITVKKIDLDEKEDLLKRIATGKADKAECLTFDCGCMIKPYENNINPNKLGVELVKVNGADPVGNVINEFSIKLNSTKDFYDLLAGAKQKSGKRFGCLDVKDGLFGWFGDEVDDKGINAFLKENRKYFADYVIQKCKDNSQGYINTNDLIPGKTFNIIPHIQALDSPDNDTYGLECFASSLMNLLKSVGLMNPLLTKKEIQKRYTYLGENAGEEGKKPSDNIENVEGSNIKTYDGAYFELKHNKTLRGFENTDSISPVFNTIVVRFQKNSDWAKLMGVNNHKVNVVKFNDELVSAGKQILKDGYFLQIVTFDYSHWTVIHKADDSLTNVLHYDTYMTSSVKEKSFLSFSSYKCRFSITYQ